MLLSTTNYIAGIASSIGVNYIIQGKNTTGYAPLNNPLGQGVLALTAKRLYTSDRDVTVETMQLTNTTGSSISVTLYLNGADTSHIWVGMTIAANSSVSYFNGVWNVGTANNYIVGVGTNLLTVSPIAPTSPNTGDLWLQT